MRVLVLGAGGMLGHKMVQRLGTDFEVAGTIRDPEPDSDLRRAITGVKLFPKVAVNNLDSIARAIRDWRAQVVLNCIGIVKQTTAAQDPIVSIQVNALLPHQLAQITAAHGAKLIHFSSDCVFSGRRGNYSEEDAPDPVDLYGRTKLLGELEATGALTLRMSIVGRELRGHLGLIDWFLSQCARPVKGYSGALYSGLTTIATADLTSWLIRAHPHLEGVWHVSGEPISKFDLLRMVNRIYEFGCELEHDATFFCDRRLDSSRFRMLTGWRPPSWEAMITAMHSDDKAFAGLYLAPARS